MADSVLTFANFKEQEQYLDERGIDRFTRDKLGLEIKTATWLHEQGFPKVPGLSRGIVWRLRDPEGTATGKLGARVFYHDVKTVAEGKPKPKFLPPKGQVPGVYFSPLCAWDKLEYGDKIYLCESYLKADICALMGFYAVGISGCWGWSYSDQLNWDFGLLPWSDLRLKPIVCFDSNVNEDNAQLWLAARRFSAAMEVKYRVQADILVLPKPKEGDWGLDDYFMEHDRDATQDYLHGETDPLPSAMSDHLKIMSKEVVLVRDIARFIEINSGIIMTRGDFENVTYANRIVWNDEKAISVAKTYTKWEGRIEVREMVYRPGAERLVAPEFYNIWEGMGVTPLAGDVSLFTDWVEAVFTPNEADYFYDWWGYQLQHLGAKLTTALVVLGVPGVGKGWITAIFEQIYGTKNVSKIPLTVLERHFNADVAAKQLMIVEETDEIAAKGQVIYNKLKDMITSTTLRLEKKGMDAYLIENTVNVFLTGNQIGIFKLDEDDRRFAIFEAINEGDIANNQEYWDPRWEWLATGGGASMIYGYLLNRDLARFNPHGQAPMTQVKRDMVEIRQSPLESWVRELKVRPDEILVAGQSEIDGYVLSAREACWIYYEGQRSMREIDRVEVTKMNAALKNARFGVANDGKKIKPTGGVPTRYFTVRRLPDNVGSWSALVKDRSFWMHLEATEQRGVAGNGDSVASPTKY